MTLARLSLVAASRSLSCRKQGKGKRPKAPEFIPKKERIVKREGHEGINLLKGCDEKKNEEEELR